MGLYFIKIGKRVIDFLMQISDLIQAGGNCEKRLDLNNVVNRGIGEDNADRLLARLPEVLLLFVGF